MRIIAGKHKGRRIEFPREALEIIRPTSEFARQAIFNILTHGKHGLNGHTFDDKRVLDVFCGTGAFGLEALSRGAAHVTFVDQAREALATARHNAERIRESEHVDFIQASATQLPPARQPYDLVFLDPPYYSKLLPPTLKSLHEKGWIARDGILVIEHDEKESVVIPTEFVRVDERRYGRAVIELLKLSPA
jgi:16S rRNA (guanine966-N2)-methyltransferase